LKYAQKCLEDVVCDFILPQHLLRSQPEVLPGRLKRRESDRGPNSR
jgi:hypothetical protein